MLHWVKKNISRQRVYKPDNNILVRSNFGYANISTCNYIIVERGISKFSILNITK